jgi:hypothetical protein
VGTARFQADLKMRRKMESEQKRVGSPRSLKKAYQPLGFWGLRNDWYNSTYETKVREGAKFTE